MAKAVHAHRSGFTLIELSIVLVIIGLIVGGMLVGRDLIRAAEVRAAIAKLEEYETAVQTFKGKYNCLPGDCINATEIGLGEVGGVGADGNGNQRLGSTAGYNAADTYENFHFWVHLANAGLVARPLVPYDSVRGLTPSKDVLPTITLGQSQVAVCYSCFLWTPADDFLGNHYFVVGRIGSDTGAATYQSPSLKALDVKNIDSKIDDGFPMSGRISPSHTDDGESLLVCPFCSSNTNCIDITVTPHQYNILGDDSPVCTMAALGGF